MSTHRANSFQSVASTWVFVFFTALLSAAAFAGSIEPCDHAYPTALGGTERFFPDGEETSLVLSVDVPASGLLALDVLSDRSAAQLLFLGKSCGKKQADDSAQRLHEFIGGALIHVRSAGIYYFRVGAQDPSLPVSEFQIRSGFANDESVGAGRFLTKDENPIEEILPIVTGCLTPFPEHDQDENYVEEALPVLVDCMTPMAAAGFFDPDDGDKDPVGGILSGLRTGGSAREQRSQLATICQNQLADDVGDSFSCASALRPGALVSGEIRNHEGDDVDVFVVTLPRRATLDVELSGDGIALAVYDRHGQPMAVSGEAPFRSARAFARGTYFLEVTGARDMEGGYTLRVGAMAD